MFGVWDSRDTGAKLPRIVQSTIQAENVDVLIRSAQYNPALDYAELGVFPETEKEKQQGKPGSKLINLVARIRPRPCCQGARRNHCTRGSIHRNVTLNLIALRRLEGKNGQALRCCILGLVLVAATAPMEGVLRAGSLLTLDPEDKGTWHSVARSGERPLLA